MDLIRTHEEMKKMLNAEGVNTTTNTLNVLTRDLGLKTMDVKLCATISFNPEYWNFFPSIVMWVEIDGKRNGEFVNVTGGVDRKYHKAQINTAKELYEAFPGMIKDAKELNEKLVDHFLNTPTSEIDMERVFNENAKLHNFI